MYDEVQQLADYLPIHAKDERVFSLINHHLDHFFRCVENELYSSSLVHLHILYMIFVYIQIQRIANANEEAFKISLIGFNREEKDLLREPNYPLLLSKVNEKTVFRFLRLNNMSDSDISMIAAPVNSRNKHLHAGEEIECENLKQFRVIYENYIKCMDRILQHNTNIYETTYSSLPNYERLNELDYELTIDDLELGVILPGYFSDIELRTVTAGREDKLSSKLREVYGYE